MSYALLKACHVISMVAWMAGVLYMGRLLIYYVEAGKRPESERQILQDQLALMQKRLWYGIAHPAMLLTIVFGSWVMMEFQVYKQPWLMGKLTFVLGFIVYHILLGRIRKQILAGSEYWTSFKLRIVNEVATVFLIVIVCLAYLKSAMSTMQATMVFVIGMSVFSLLVWILRRKKRA